MKKSLLILLVLFSFPAMGQHYKLFYAGSKKLFTTHLISNSTFSLAFDSVKINGADSVYFNFTFVDDEYIEPDTCDHVFMNFVSCCLQNKPSWVGVKIIYDNISRYKFITNSGNTLYLNFNLLPGDSTLFFSDASQQFYMVYEGADTATYLGIPDSAKFYRISHTDLSGNAINSPLNSNKIIVGKELGLVRFFRIDGFPQVLQPLVLVGNVSPDAGLIKLTNEMIYDHQPGDEIQYLDRYSKPGGPPWYNYHRYTKHQYLKRTETQGFITYLVAKTTFVFGSNTATLDTISLAYKRDAILAEIPYERIDQNNVLYTKQLYNADYCGLSLWSYAFSPIYLLYCVYDKCWGPFDTFGQYGPGPPPTEKTIYVCGLGLYNHYSFKHHYIPDGYNYTYKIVYFKKYGISCGNELVVGVNDPNEPTTLLTVYPNPAKDYLIIESENNSAGVLFIINLNGQILIQTIVNNPKTTVDIRKLNAGMYLLKLISGKDVEFRKIIKH